MANSPQVSVIMIFLNAAAFMEEAIASILAQTFTDWELLLVDDGSSDGSSEIARRHAGQQPQRIHYLTHPGHANRGMSAARNLGIAHATGEFVAFLDADDVWRPQKLAHQVAVLAAQPQATMLYGRTRYWHSWADGAAESDFMPDLGLPVDHLYRPPSLLPLFLAGRATVPCTCSLLVRRAALARLGGFETRFRGMYEDQAFYAKICLESAVYVDSACLDWYRQHPDSACAVAGRSGQAEADRLDFLTWLAGYLRQINCTDTAVWRALKAEQWLLRQPAWLPYGRYIRPLLRWSKKWLLRWQRTLLPVAGRVSNRMNERPDVTD